MVDTNLPQGWGVYDHQEQKIIAEYGNAREALEHCQRLEPEDLPEGHRYTMRPIRIADTIG